MTNVVSLNNVDHADLKLVRADAGAETAINQALVFPNEFEQLQREFPILFRKGPDEAFQAVVLLGLDRDENLFVVDQRWRTRIVPALLQRGPFSIGIPAQGGEDAGPMIHVDLDDPRVSRTEGVALFHDHGGNTPLLDHIAAVLRTIYAGLDLSAPMFAAFEAEGLIENAALTIALDDAHRYRLNDYYTLDAERFASLDGAALERLHRAGFLGCAMWALSSLGNIARLIELKNERRHG
ncbi:SapC family protein [Hephaestia sp. GCM10023244]|uniref:SapC family protein n=1 Tax=unclassified Hephaestia TaxID=2631281 RepID=UPI0020778CF0|nr:SapC family protein [Hephaestia sp. MAHUQ-44]MCM8732160.1 SapC family protein [Hephaestia sp. MAHUQ-44]